MITQPSETPKTILLVEDEGLVLLSLKMAFEEFNYRILTATNGDDALQQYVHHKNEIDLVVTDMSMPGMDGMNLLAALRSQSPNLRVILMTGHLLDPDTLDIHEHKPTRCVTKPIGLDSLLQIVAEVLMRGHV